MAQRFEPAMSVFRRGPAHSDTGAILLMFAVVAALFFAREILIPLAFALTLSFLLTPAVTFLEKLRMGRVLPVILTVLISMAAGGWITWIIANQLVDVASQLPTYRQNIHAKIETLRNRGKGPLGRAADTAKRLDASSRVRRLWPLPKRLWCRIRNSETRPGPLRLPCLYRSSRLTPADWPTFPIC